MRLLIDPRRGDIEDDASSTKSNSLLAMAGSLLGEISFAKLLAAWLVLIVVPAVVLGVAPLIVTAWVKKLAGTVAPGVLGVVPILIFAAVAALGWLLGRRLLRLAESSFWSLNALIVEPLYTMFREALRHLAELALPDDVAAGRRERSRALAAAASGVIISVAAVAVLLAVWPASRWMGEVADLTKPATVAWIALANTTVVVATYIAVAALIWGIADATMAPPRDLPAFAQPLTGRRVWRVAHLSDLHIVGERYGYRIESGRGGPQGDGRFRRILARLEEIDAAERLDAILISGDATDAGRSVEWAEFLDGLSGHPQLAARMLLLPGNHDINIVDRANPARLDLAIGPNSRLRRLRTLSAIAAVQGDRARLFDRERQRLGAPLADTLQNRAGELAAFADTGRPMLSTLPVDLWADAFPMIVPPDGEDGIGFVLLNSNADAHFSFTNALGLVSAEQVHAMEAVVAQYPGACWIVGLHHHPVEYPRRAKVLSERIGTTLVNGNWFLRRIAPLAERIVLMHGHRHVDWIGECGGVRVISAPSPVMEATNEAETYFYIHRLQVGEDGCLELLAPQRVDIEGEGCATRAAAT